MVTFSLKEREKRMNKKSSGQKLSTQASKIMRSNNSSQIQKSLAASVLSQRNTGKITGKASNDCENDVEVVADDRCSTDCCCADTLCLDMSWLGLCIRSGSGSYQHDYCFVRCCSADYIFSAERAYSVVDGIFD